ncbi:MAG: trans-sulfuration enzyme family protein [Chitinophagaceae bacterium]
MDISSIINELGEERNEYFRAVAPPLIQTSNFAFNTVDALRKSFADEYSTWLYSRGLNPTVDILRKKLAALDGAEDCLVFNSGAAAIYAAVMANVKKGDHIISVAGVYTWAQKIFDFIVPKFGISCTYIDGTNITNFEKALQPNTRLVYLESPNSWTFDLQNLHEVAFWAKQNNLITICDNSYCTPIYQQPIQLGIDLAIQSATKYIGGHSDTVAGVLSGSNEQIKNIFNTEYLAIGSGIQPFNAWLLLRGLRTLPTRLKAITNTTHLVINYLKTENMIEKILFPFDETFPQLLLAKQQMKGACGLFTIQLKPCTAHQIETFCNSLQHFLMAVSWGGYESLIIPKLASMPINQFNGSLPQHRQLRIYVGLEEADLLISDLKQAFALAFE